MTYIDELDTLYLDEFDVGTRIVRMTDGSLRLILGLMPPSWCSNEGVFESFGESLEEALGVKVSCQDKELFVIQQPRSDTFDALRGYLMSLCPSPDQQ